MIRMMTSELPKHFPAFTFQQFSVNYPMQMCNTVQSNVMPGTTLNNQIINNNNLTATSTANGNLDNIKSTTNFSINDDSNGVKDVTKKSARDPLSHRIIEKRRRDRMNKCLNDLSRLIPQHYIKKGRGRVEKTEIVEMAIKYINHLRDNKSNFNSPETFKNLSFGDQLVDNSLSKLNNFSSINLYKDESEQSNASLQNSLQNSMNQNLNKQFNDSSNDDYLNGFRDCYTEVIQFLTTSNEAKLLQVSSLHQPALKDRLNEQMIIDLRNYLDNFLKKQQFNQFNSKRRVDFSGSTKSFNNCQSVDGLQIKLEEMDVEESSSRLKNKNLNDKLNFEDKFPKLTLNNNCCTNNNLPKSLANSNSISNNLNLNSSINTANFNKTLKNYLTNNELLKTDYLKNNFNNNSNLDLNPTIKSRSLTSSPNSSNLDAAYKFKSSIKEKFDAEFNSKLNRLDDSKAMSRPRSATVGANAASIDKIRRLNTTLELKEKIVSSNTELNADRLEKLMDNRSSNINSIKSLNNSLHNQQLKLNSIKKPIAGFILHPNQSYYIPVEIDLNNLTQQIKTINRDELLNLQNLHNNLTNLHQTNSSKPQQLNHQLNQNAFLNINGSQNSLFQDHLSYSSPSLNSLNSINNSSIPNYLNQSIKCCLDDKFLNENIEPILYPISISVNFKFPPLSLNASVLNSQKSSNLF